jgi:dihydroneopterin aldolase
MKNELVNYQILAEKIADLVKGENYDDVEKAVESLMSSLKRRSIVN